jgi:hypothetical protein
MVIDISKDLGHWGEWNKGFLGEKGISLQGEYYRFTHWLLNLRCCRKSIAHIERYLSCAPTLLIKFDFTERGEILIIYRLVKRAALTDF